MEDTPAGKRVRPLLICLEEGGASHAVTASVADRVYELLAPLAADHGYDLVTCEIVGPKGSPVVRVYLDREDGVDLDAITEANAWISEALEADEPVDGPWVLEVSSPGVERPLRTLEDFQRYAGQRVSVKTHRPLDGRRRFTGVLTCAEGGGIMVDCDGIPCAIPMDAIAKANLKPEIDFGEE
jgi:ribosome maturation factor RimP